MAREINSGLTYHGAPISWTDAELVTDLSRKTLARIKEVNGVTECAEIIARKDELLSRKFSSRRTVVTIDYRGQKYTVRQLARILGVSTTLVYKYIANGQEIPEKYGKYGLFGSSDLYADEWEINAKSREIPTADELLEDWRSLRLDGKHGINCLSQLSMKTGDALFELIDQLEDLLKKRQGNKYVNVFEGRRGRKMRHVGKKAC